MATNNNKKRLNNTYGKTTSTVTSPVSGSMAGNSYSAAIGNKNSASGTLAGNIGSGINKVVGNLASGASGLASDVIKNAVSGVSSGKTPYEVAQGMGYKTKTNYTDTVRDYLNNLDKSYTLPETPALPEVSPELEQEIQQSVSLPTSMPTLSELPTFNSEYLDQLNALAEKLTSMNYEDWTQGDQYKTLADRYGDMGRMSMQDVLGQIAGRTGGLASSYATSAAQQQYNDYMTQLEDVARSLYSSDRSDLMNDFSTLRNLYTDEYTRYRDTVEDEYQRYRDQVSDYLNMLELQNKLASGSGGGSTYNITGATAPKITTNKTAESAANTGTTSFTNLKRTIATAFGTGSTSRAASLIGASYDGLSETQQEEIDKLAEAYGFEIGE